MSTLELENIKHADASSNAIELASDGTLEVVGSLTGGVSITGPASGGSHALEITTNNTADGGLPMRITRQAENQEGIITFRTNTSPGYNWYVGHDNDSTSNFQIGNDAAYPAIRCDASGRVTNPQQPHIFGSPVNTGGAGIANSFSTLLSQGGLSFSNSRITVPVAGLYLVTFNTITDQTSSSRQDTHIVINGNHRVNGLNETNTSGYHYRSHSAVFKLAANDYIQFENDDWYNSGNSGFENWRTASVTLIG